MGENDSSTIPAEIRALVAGLKAIEQALGPNQPERPIPDPAALLDLYRACKLMEATLREWTFSDEDTDLGDMIFGQPERLLTAALRKAERRD